MRHSTNLYLTIISLLASITSVTAAATYQGCYVGDSTLSTPVTYDYQSQGHCMEQCQTGGFAVFAMTNGNGCSCGNSIPSTTSSSCDIACVGYPSDTCGGTTAYSVWLTGTGTVSSGSSSAAAAASAGTTKKSSTTAAAAAATAAATTPVTPTVIYVTTAVVQQGVTIIQTVSASTRSSSASSTASAGAQQGKTSTKSGKSGISGGAIAGIVIGVLVLAAISAVTAFVCLRRRNKQTEEFGEYKKHIEPAGAGVTRQPSSLDNRLDTSLAIRRDSSESLADNQDYSRKILRVVN